MKRLAIILFIFYSTLSYAQDKSNIGFGANVGYKCPSGEAGFILEYKFKKIVDIYSGISYAKFNGFGYTIGSDLYLTKKQWQPCVGIAYNYQSGDNFFVGEDGVDRTDFKVNSNSNLVGIIGVRKIVFFDDKSANGFMAFTPYISYRYSSPSTAVTYTSGNINEERENKINNRIGNGIGIGLKMVYFINRNKANQN